jgi:class 3 adenylate cyclase
MTAARRLAAMLAADVVGYSRLNGEDEAGTAKAVRERREASTPIVASLGGRIVKMTGDGLLLEFPSVVAAVECAIEIRSRDGGASLTACARLGFGRNEPDPPPPNANAALPASRSAAGTKGAEIEPRTQ